MNSFEDLEHAMITGVVLGTLRRAGLNTDALLNDTEDTTPYLRLNLEGGLQALIVVLPPGE